MKPSSLLPTTTTLLATLLTLLAIIITPPTAQSFQTPIIFPLLWLSKRLTSNDHQFSNSPPSHRRAYRNNGQRLSPPPPSLRINAIRTTTTTRRPLFLVPPLSTLANFVATKLQLKNDQKINDEKLLSWILNESSSSDDNNNNNNLSITIDSHPKTKLRGLFATKDIRQNEFIVEVPYRMALLVGDTLRKKKDSNTAAVDDFISSQQEDNDWDEDDVEDVLQGLYFLKNFVSGGSFDASNGGGGDGQDTSLSSLDSEYYSPYVVSLPPKPTTTTTTNNDNNNYDDEEGLTPDFWSESIIHEIGIPTYSQRILNRKRILQSIAQRANVNESDLQWATFLVRSRRFTTWNMVPDPNYNDNTSQEGGGGGLFGVFPITLGQTKIEQIQGFLVPLIDMANHHPTPNAVMKISVNKWTRQFDTSSSFALRATRPISKGEEVTISYGDGSGTCLEMLDKYGFFVENNEDARRVDMRGVDDLKVLKPTWMTNLEEDEMELDRLVRGGRGGSSMDGKDSSSLSSASSSKLKTIISRLQDEYTFNFPPTLQDYEQMKLIGSGIREKMGIKVYAVGMYGSSSLLGAVSPSDLRYKARQFDFSSSSEEEEEEETGTGMTSFLLEMILQAEGKVIAEAIADSVGVRYDGPRTDVEQLENLINDGISGKGGQANKGTMLRFDCTKEGVSLSVDGVERGIVKASGLGRAFVDVYLDNDAVSPSLIDSCVENCSMADNALKEGANVGDVAGGSASRRTMLSLRIWLKRLKKWTKPEGASVVASNESAVNNEGTVVVEASDGGNTGFISGAQGAEQLSADSTRDSSDEDTTEKAEDIVAVEEVSSGEIISASTSDEVSSDDLAAVEPTAIESLIEPVDVQPTLPPAVNQDLEPKSAVSAMSGLPRVVTPPPTPMQAASVLDKSDYDANKIAARIRELEAEIAEEIIRVRSQQGAPISDGSSSQESLAGVSASSPDAGTNPPLVDEKAAAVESKVKSLKEKATGVSFDPKLEDGLFLVGAGVRKKAIINVYAVAMYSSPTAIASLGSMNKGKDAQSALRDSSRTFNSLTPKTSFVLEMTFKADGKTIAEAIVDGVKPRHSGSAADVAELEHLIVEGVKSKGGQATKGTIFRFDCDAEGVAVSVDGTMQGRVASEGIGSAFVDVFMDDKAVSPQLVDSCMDTWCGSGL